ncbi:glycine--tRNA ligase subunit beta [Sphingomonas donggukensis]|uniref:Glycine--tRNA ligase beta subunit n=1 Tax=Sphingomonas donggukensis TaxID=2949093 RepID=A0ABY4TU86_9SPHN|nr:glycine--tRNA ligase subunit beta [Sphingomonas donggukensis]URW75975.1 glycine--tRNA ligase subunit beta [Sphingomonas donggukensis]
MTDFLLELRSEEIPARMQARAREDLAKLFAAELAKAGLTATDTTTYATPRRLTLIARGLPLATEAVSDEVKGPKTSAPAQALEGFLRKTGLTQDQLTDRDGIWFAVIEKPGRATADVLAEAIPAIVRAFPWPKSMRWGDASASTESLRWVRPLQGIVALFGDDVVPCEIAGIASGAATVGHRFHHPGVITIGSAGDYVEKLRACHVIVDQDERAAIIATGATMAAKKAGLTLIRDEGLLAENAGLTEWPVPLLGRFDPEFLTVPPEVIQLTARVNQKYFVCTDAAGKLANAFVCVANIDAKDGGALIVEGNRKVLAARLSDARFFWAQDLKVEPREQSRRLANVKYFEGLGTYQEKQERIGRLIEELVALYFPELKRLWSTAELCKVDLLSGTVGEFPELQGVVGSYLLKNDQYAAPYAQAVRGLYKNASQIIADGENKPENLLQVADRIDNVVGFAAVGIWFKGSGDPYGIRQSAQAVVAAILTSKLRLKISDLIKISYVNLVETFGFHRNLYAVERLTGIKGEIRDIETPMFGAGLSDAHAANVRDYLDRAFRAKAATREELKGNGFVDWAIDHARTYYADDISWLAPYAEVSSRVEALLIDRLKVQQREAGVRHDLIDAVFALGGEDDLVRLLARVHALQAFVATPDGTNLLAGYKRAANILKKEGFTEADDKSLSYTPEPAEKALADALDLAELKARTAVEQEDFEAAMAALATLRAPIDAFFDGVTVNDADPDKRAHRLGLLVRVRDAVHAVADFSKIEG